VIIALKISKVNSFLKFLLKKLKFYVILLMKGGANMASFKDRFNEALALRDMSAAELSKRTGIGEGALSQYKKGAYNATQRNLDKISSALNVSIPWLMGISDTMEIEDIQDDTPSPARQMLLEATKDLSDEQVLRVLGIIEEVKKLF
jgi:transcriptional regulator with XRE-family HTH domain